MTCNPQPNILENLDNLDHIDFVICHTNVTEIPLRLWIRLNVRINKGNMEILQQLENKFEKYCYQI
jgi:hypothetical protein